MNLEDKIAYLIEYSGPPIRLMEVCGTHTHTIVNGGIRNIISNRIQLISGPGCPVCVTPDGYIDKLIALALEDRAVICSFGDMLKVPGMRGSLAAVRGEGVDIRMVYSPFEVLTLAQNEPEKQFVFAAVGFETILPVYALFVEKLIRLKRNNIRLLLAVKRMPPILQLLCKEDIDGFLAPGHVAAVIGWNAFVPLAKTFQKPFTVSGFELEQVLDGIYDLVDQLQTKHYEVHNRYPSVVTKNGNETALAKTAQYFDVGDALWRGIGTIPQSGCYLKEAFSCFDAGSREIAYTQVKESGCRCGEIIVGHAAPKDCPLYAAQCTPMNPRGPCMVSEEGACSIWFRAALH